MQYKSNYYNLYNLKTKPNHADLAIIETTSPLLGGDACVSMRGGTTHLWGFVVPCSSGSDISKK